MPRPVLLLFAGLTGCIDGFPEPPAEPADLAFDSAPPEDARPPPPDLEPPCGTPEVCDGLDNDCNGKIDEGVPIRRCPLQQGVCAASRQVCADGIYQPCTYADLDQLYMPDEGPDACDGADNDCDGATDEGCGCEVGESRVCGTNEGECAVGRQLCEMGAFGRCAGAREPVLEHSNGVDDDCDGVADEGPPPDEITLDLADLAIGGLGGRPGLPPQVARARGLPLDTPGARAEFPAPRVVAVFIPQRGPTEIGGGLAFDFGEDVPPVVGAGVHAKGPAQLVPHPADVLGLEDYRDAATHSFLEVPTSYGITFDIGTLRVRFGRPARRLSVRLGNLGAGRVKFFVLEDGELRVGQTLSGARELQAPFEIDLADTTRLLTLVATSIDDVQSRAAYLGDPTLFFR